MNIESVCSVWAHWWIQTMHAPTKVTWGRRVKRFKRAPQLRQKLAEGAVCNFPTTAVKVRRFYLQKLLHFGEVSVVFFRIGSKNQLKRASTDLNYLCATPTAVDLKQTLNVALYYTPTSKISWKVHATQNEELLDHFHALDIQAYSLVLYCIGQLGE